ncbi:TetR family transcriptional regulator [Caballeronia udeis]|uniref:TetR family transcriptional regulator n=1 Tax=Caballeronia udeis TaxID=1232866 RepID=A0A158GYN0_9BURK|nr:TetR/AcrR family transcriptional regulator [Caballeronia udeis]SAL37225.1 TetR family transcriptional regulator [Caballeronia udeis]
MARQKNEGRRQAIIDAAIVLIAREGLGAATAAIAKEANIPNGSLFTYFPTKNDLLNQLYLEIKSEVIESVDEGFSDAIGERAQMLHMWTRWTAWGARNAEKRRVLAQLSASDLIPEEVKLAGYTAANRSVNLVQQVASQGALRDQAPAFAGAIVESFAATTMDFMIRDPARADEISLSAFEALWKALR